MRCTLASATTFSPKPAPSVQRDLLLVGEMIEAADRIRPLVGDLDVDELSRHLTPPKTDRSARGESA